jgi:uncharacterized membrane protein
VKARVLGLGIVFLWFAVGGVAHFVMPEFFLKIVPPSLPLRLEAVYVSGACELAGAVGILWWRTRRAAGIGLMLLVIAVTPANVYMWMNAQLFPAVPEWLLAFRLVVQIGLLALIGWATLPAALPANSARAARNSV